MSIKLQFTPWGNFRAEKNEAEIQRWLNEVGNKSKDAFRVGASRQWAGGRGAPPGQWPMKRSGTLLRSIDYKVTADTVTVGSAAKRKTGKGFDYSRWLRDTGRLMSERALKLGIIRAKLGRWVHWVRY